MTVAARTSGRKHGYRGGPCKTPSRLASCREKWRITASEIPDSFGVQGPGENNVFAGASNNFR